MNLSNDSLLKLIEKFEELSDILQASAPWPIDLKEREKFIKKETFRVINEQKWKELKKEFILIVNTNY